MQKWEYLNIVVEDVLIEKQGWFYLVTHVGDTQVGKYEKIGDYYFWRGEDGKFKNLREILPELGEQGWELVQVVERKKEKPLMKSDTYIFKRAKSD